MQFKDKPDSYAVLNVGAISGETRVVKNTTDPEWENEEW